MDLPALYASREFADLTLIAANGEEFQVHRLVLGQFPQLKALVIDAEERNRRVALPESADAIRSMVQFMYSVPWSRDPGNSVEGRAHALMKAVELAHVAEKYDIPNMAKDAYAAAGRVMRTIDSMADGLRLLRETTANSVTGVLQRTLIEKSLEMPMPNHDKPSPHANKKRDRTSEAAALSLLVEETQSEQDSEGPLEFESPSKETKMPKKSTRPKKPTEKAKAPLMPQRRKKSKPTESSLGEATLHCTRRVPEDKYMVQCEGCHRWFHPGWVRKGTSSNHAYKGRGRAFALMRDEKFYRENDIDFTCAGCDAKAES